LKATKSENLLFAGSVSKKGQAKLALFWWKGKVNHYPSARDVGAHAVRPYNRTGRAGFALGLTV
jgi:hypothetical protein